MVHWHWNSQICLVNVPFFITHFNFKFKSNSNKMVNLQWEHDNETKKNCVRFRQSLKQWWMCCVHLSNKNEKKYLQVTWALRYIYGRVHTKKNYGQLLPLLLFLFIFNLNLFSWLASYDNSRFFIVALN